VAVLTRSHNRDNMFKRRSRLARPTRETTPSTIEEQQAESGDESSIADLLELRRMRRAKEGIDTVQLHKGAGKRRRRLVEDDLTAEHGLQVKSNNDMSNQNNEDETQIEAKTRKVIRANNFTQQTNALDVDKHMMAYIEENIKARQGPSQPAESSTISSFDPHDELFRIDERYKIQMKSDEGSVTNSIGMLTSIPEVDLGMDTRLKNIEETEKAKRLVVEERKERAPGKHLDGTDAFPNARFYRGNRQQKSDAEVMRDARLEVIGQVPAESSRSSYLDRPQLATDEEVMERFKKRMRK